MIVTATAPDRWEFLPLGPRTQARFEAELAALNTATRAVASLYGAEVLDVAGHAGLSRQENFAGDGLHPSPLGHRRAAEGFRALVADRFPIRIERGVIPMTSTTLGAGTHLVSRARTITESDLVSFAAITGDWHPQHVDAEWAADSRFGERIAHGMLVLSYSVGLMGFDPERVVALRGIDSLTFKRPVAIGDTIRAEADVDDVRPIDDDHELVELRWRVLTGDDRLALRARVTIVHRPAGHEVPGTASCEWRVRGALWRESASLSGLLDGKRVLVTGVVNRHSIAYAIAEGAQREGAEILLTSFGRVRRMTERAARSLDPVPDVLELDVDSDQDLAQPPRRTRHTLGFGRRDRPCHRLRAA